MKKRAMNGRFLVSFLVLGILFLGFVLGTVPNWQGDTTTYHSPEDNIYYHDLSNNITGYNNDVSFEFDTQGSINWTNASGSYSVDSSVISSWISILNSTTGNLSINATYDNQTGFFQLPIQASNTSSVPDAQTAGFEFQINATNDYPNFTQITNEYNWSHNANLAYYINGTDEEEHYPLNFSVVFNGTCSHASWSGRNSNENCSLSDFGFNLTEFNNLSSIMNFTPGLNDVGTYYANISVTDFNGICPHAYCDSSTYEGNKSTYYSEMVVFNIKANLEINASDCENKILNESQEFTCDINITTPGISDSLTIATDASLRNYADTNILNTSWFYADSSTSSSSFIKTVNINVTPTKNEVGNWSINFSVYDSTSAIAAVEEIIFIQVDKNDSLEYDLTLSTISNVTTSSDLLTTVNLEVIDLDLLIPDKSSLGGYNETITFYLDLLSSSSTINETFTISNQAHVIDGSDHLTNRTTAEISFTSNSSESGTYILNLTVGDKNGTNVSQVFEIAILNNAAPQWNALLNDTYVLYENDALILNLSLNVSDANNDSLTFSYVLDGYSFPSMNLTNEGVINMTFNDSDVGEHIVSITVSDGYLDNSTDFNFTILNVVDNLSRSNFLALGNATGDVNGVNFTEDGAGIIQITIDDYDLLIPANQSSRGFYNESFDFNITFINYSSGSEVYLFNFTEDRNPSSPTIESYQTRFDVTFTPNKSHVGTYNVTINITDNGTASDTINFNLTILDINHAPNITALVNQTTGVNRTLTYDIFTDDFENGNDSVGNLVYSYDFISGDDFISGNETIFNTTTGALNITFNSTHAGLYQINITVNDSLNLTSSDLFYIFIYDNPTINFPILSNAFSLKENVSSNIIYQGNHSVGDNLTYLFYIERDGNSTLRENVTTIGNATNATWVFTPNFTDETYGSVINLTMVVYPANVNLTNATEYSINRTWNLTINHTNNNLTLTTEILDETGGSPQTMTLSDYFTDYDASDSYYNQSVRFSYTLISQNGSSVITPAIIDWVDGATPTVVFTADGAATARYSITASEYNLSDNEIILNVTSNEFDVEITETESTSTSTTSTTSSSRTNFLPFSLKLIMPEPVSAFKKDKIVLPLSLLNNGKVNLKGISLAGIILKDNITRDDFVLDFSKDSFDNLGIGEQENLTLTIDIDTDVLGVYEITINAKVKSPEYLDWGKFYLTIDEDEDVKERLLFTEEFILDNPECIELTEIVNRARQSLENGETTLALQMIDSAVEGCKLAISQTGRLKEKREDISMYIYVIGSILSIFLLSLGSYFYRRMKLSKASLDFEEEKLEMEEKDKLLK